MHRNHGVVWISGFFSVQTKLLNKRAELMDSQTKAYAYTFLAILAWSTVASAFKLSLQHLNFIQLLFFASGTSAIVLFAIVVFQKKLNILFTYSKKEYLNSALLGFLNPFLYYFVLFQAYAVLPAQEAQSLNYTWAIMLAILSIPLLKQKISLTSILAIIISFLGTIVIATHGNIFGLQFTNLYGAVLALGSSLIWALFWIYNVKDKRDPVVKLFLNGLFGFMFIALVSLLIAPITWPNVSGLLGSVYVGLFEMSFTFAVWLTALQLSKTTAQVTNLVYLSPFLSLIVIHFMVPGEEILLSTVLGLILIIAGVLLQQRNKKN
ncbi:MAG: DMT family transporter [Candidatus Diapherotrites archaeon]|nr:DMT family transporter [Candidatus Diapherotrites archaeon]